MLCSVVLVYCEGLLVEPALGAQIPFETRLSDYGHQMMMQSSEFASELTPDLESAARGR